MRNVLFFAGLLLAGVTASAQGILDRYTDPEKGKVVFIRKGNHALGIAGGYRNFNVTGDASNNSGYAILSLLNIGEGSLHTWNVTPSISWFVADDLSLGLDLEYDGYTVDTDLNLDFRDIIPIEAESLNLKVSNRHMAHQAWGASFAVRKYMSFFGSNTFAVFGEGRLFTNYGETMSEPRERKMVNRDRESYGFGVGVKLGGGLAVKLRDGSAITVSVPIFGVSWNATNQTKHSLIVHDAEAFEANPNDPEASTLTTSNARMTQLSASRNTDILGIKFGYVRYIEPRNKRK